MGEEAYSISHLASQTKNVGYYAGLVFGVGYCLTMVGFIAMFLEVIVRAFELIPDWLMAALVTLILGMICGIYFGSTIIKNSASARNSGLNATMISLSLSAFSFMLILIGISSTIVAAELDLSLFSPICGVVGPILLLVGFRAYQSGVSESKLMGAIIMLVSIALIYFVAYGESLLSPSAFFGEAGPLFSQLGLEAVSLLIVIVCAIIFAFPILGKELKQPVEGIILSTSAILFSVGVMYFNFRAASDINNMISLAGMTGSTITDTVWIIFFGFLLLGISGIIALITACFPLALSVKQLSTKVEAQALKAPEAPPKPAAEVKYCPKCGANMPLDAVYCLKCGHEQPKMPTEKKGRKKAT